MVNTGKGTPAEQPAVRTTIVGGRPPGPGQGVGSVPRGIEVLVKKAAVDPAFKALLLTERSAAAAGIGLELSETETAILDGVPAAQLEAIIANTTVNPKLKPAFMGRAAAVMLAALGVGLAGCGDDGGTEPEVRGIRPDEPEVRESTESETTDDVENPRTDGYRNKAEDTGSIEKTYGADDGNEIDSSKGPEIDESEDLDRVVERIGGLTGTRPDLPPGGELKKTGSVTVVGSGPSSIEGPGAVSEGRTAARINHIVRQHLAGIQNAYNSVLKGNPDLGSGKITVSFIISADGSVTSATVLSSTMDSPDLEAEVISRVYGWRFPAIEEGDVTVIYPFEFINPDE